MQVSLLVYMKSSQNLHTYQLGSAYTMWTFLDLMRVRARGPSRDRIATVPQLPCPSSLSHLQRPLIVR